MIQSVSSRVICALGLCAIAAGCAPSTSSVRSVIPNPSPTASSIGATPTPAPGTSASPSASAMWGLIGNSVVEFASSPLASGTVTPYHQFTIPSANFPQDNAMAFDRSGNLWIGEGNTNVGSNGNFSGQILEFTATQLAALATAPNPTPHATVTVAGAADGLAFDASGNLWASVVAFSAQHLMEFGSAQLAAGSGSPTPAVDVTVQLQGAIAFGSDGTLWIAPTTVFGPSAGLLEGFAPSQLMSSAAQSAQYVLRASGTGLVNSGQEAIVESPNQLGFDAAGNLWSIFNGNTFAFAASALHASNAPTMTSFQGYSAQSAGGPTTVDNGYALAFDSSFNLIENSSTDALHGYTASQYATGATFTSSTLAAESPYTGTAQGNFLIAGPYIP